MIEFTHGAKSNLCRRGGGGGELSLHIIVAILHADKKDVYM